MERSCEWVMLPLIYIDSPSWEFDESCKRGSINGVPCTRETYWFKYLTHQTKTKNAIKCGWLGLPTSPDILHYHSADLLVRESSPTKWQPPRILSTLNIAISMKEYEGPNQANEIPNDTSTATPTTPRTIPGIVSSFENLCSFARAMFILRHDLNGGE